MTSSSDQIYRIIGQRIRAERKKQNISQERLTTLAEIDRSHMGFIEQGRRRPTVATLYKIIKPLDIRLEVLFQGL